MLSHRVTSVVSAPEAIHTLDNLPRKNKELLRVTRTLITRVDQARSVTTRFTEEERELQSPAEGLGNSSARFQGSLLPPLVEPSAPREGMQACEWLGAGMGANPCQTSHCQPGPANIGNATQGSASGDGCWQGVSVLLFAQCPW